MNRMHVCVCVFVCIHMLGVYMYLYEYSCPEIKTVAQSKPDDDGELSEVSICMYVYMYLTK